MQRKFSFAVGEYYHVYNRGVEKRTIFLDEADKRRFQTLLFLANGTRPFVYRALSKNRLLWEKRPGDPLTSIVAYALMPNHFHCILREDREGGISEFIGKLSTSFSMYFNTRYDRSGPLLCHPFRAQHVSYDDYFRWLMSYIHLNPLDIFAPGWKRRHEIDGTRAAQFLSHYPYSSYQDYAGSTRPEAAILAKEALPIYASDLETAADMLEEFRELPEDGEIDFS